jgi:hypothetical protein
MTPDSSYQAGERDCGPCCARIALLCPFVRDWKHSAERTLAVVASPRYAACWRGI